MALTKGGVDAVIELDLTANAALLPGVLRPRGTLVVYGTGPQVQFPGSFCLVNNITVKFLLVYELTADERARAVADITRMLEANTLIHNVAATFPLADIVEGARDGGAGQGDRKRGACRSGKPSWREPRLRQTRNAQPAPDGRFRMPPFQPFAPDAAVVGARGGDAAVSPADARAGIDRPAMAHHPRAGDAESLEIAR